MRFLILLTLMLGSCSLYKDARDTVSKMREMAERVEIPVQKVSAAVEKLATVAGKMGEQGEGLIVAATSIKKVVTDADKNKDGKVSGINEWYAVLAGFAAVLGSLFVGKKKLSSAKRQLWDAVGQLRDDKSTS